MLEFPPLSERRNAHVQARTHKKHTKGYVYLHEEILSKFTGQNRSWGANSL